MQKISIELKIIVSLVLFTMLVISVDRYQFSTNIMQQFIKSKKSKNNLLIDTISPIIALNISLGLERANTEYLDQIVKQNSDLEFFELKDSNQKVLYSYSKNFTPEPFKEISNDSSCNSRFSLK